MLITMLCSVTGKQSNKRDTQISNITRRRSESAYICQVHDNVIMYTSTRLHIRASLVMYVHSRCLPTIMTSSIMTACCGVCGKFIGNGVNIFVHFSSTPTSILNLTTSSESQYNDVSNDILSVRKYFQLFTHESNIQYVIPPIQTNGTECKQTDTHTKVKT